MYSKLSIVIPVYNEINTIREILEKVKSVNIGLKKEIILVEDFSTDGTRDVLKEIQSRAGEKNSKNFEEVSEVKVIFHDKNYGKGAALRSGFQQVTGDITIIQDADLEYDPQDYVKLIEPIIKGEADVVYGSRFLNKNKANLKNFIPSHYFGNRLVTAISNLFTRLNLTDMETCYKVFKSPIIKQINIKSNRFGFEPEITAKIAKRKYKIVELPISYKARSFSEGKKISWKDGISAIYHIVRFSFLD